MSAELTEADDMQANEYQEPREPRKCKIHKWATVYLDEIKRDESVAMDPLGKAFCVRCGKVKDVALSRRGKQSRNYGNRAELKVARTYGGAKIGHAGGPVDVRGKDFDTQVKTHRRLPPLEWTKSFSGMAQGNRCPRLLLRFVNGPGKPPADYFVFQADDFLAWFGKDE